jgi:hypothetical protein
VITREDCKAADLYLEAIHEANHEWWYSPRHGTRLAIDRHLGRVIWLRRTVLEYEDGSEEVFWDTDGEVMLANNLDELRQILHPTEQRPEEGPRCKRWVLI